MRSRIPKGMGRIVAVFLFVACAVLLVSSEKPAFTTADKAFYADEKLVNFVRPGLVTKITSAEIASDGTIKARVKITDPKGLPLDRLGVTTPGAVSLSIMAARIPNGATQYVAYTTRVQTSPITKVSATQAGADSGGTWTQISDGVYEYTFATKAKNFDSKETQTIGVWSSRNLETDFGLGTQYSDDVYNFVPAGGAPAVVRDVVKTETCNHCHNPLMAHGGSRQKVELCVMCHQPQTSDPDTGNTVNFPVMIHRIHAGAELPSVQAGKPYQIIGNAQSMHDFSTVEFPVSQLEGKGVMSCETCHAQNVGAKQADAYLKPNRAACGACHDNVNFATGENHGDLPQISDNQCGTCHTPQGELEFDLSIKGAHTFPEYSATRPGLNIKILSVTGKAGEKPTVTFSVKNDAGQAITIPEITGGQNRIGLVLAGPTSDYGFANFGSDVTTAGYVSEDPRAKASCAADGTCTYTFTHAIPADAKGTFAIGAEGRRALTLLPGTKKEVTTEYGAKNDVFYFSVDGSALTPRRQVVSIDKCNSCHGQLALHGHNRNQIEQCVLCHNPMENDKARRPASEMPPQSINFAYMIHRIHTGEQATTAREFTIYGFGGSKNDFTEVRFPGDRRDCNACHVNDSQQVNGKEDLAAVNTPRALTNPTPRITNACTGCHTDTSTASHALANTTTLGESCAACHGVNYEFSVNKMHAR